MNEERIPEKVLSMKVKEKYQEGDQDEMETTDEEGYYTVNEEYGRS
jgi:hypothetical protein